MMNVPRLWCKVWSKPMLNHRGTGDIARMCYAGGAHTNRANQQPAPGKHPGSHGERCEATRTTDTGVTAPAAGCGTQVGMHAAGFASQLGCTPLTSTELAAVPQGSDAFLVLEQAVAAHRLAKARP